MARRGRLAGILIVVAAAVMGCGRPSPSAPALTSDPIAVANDLRYACSGFPFDPAIAKEPGIAEAGIDDAAAALRAALVPGGLPDAGIAVPAAGWHLTGQDATSVEFVNFANGRVMYIRLERKASGEWGAAGWGDCQPEILLPDGLGVATWEPDPVEPAPGPKTTIFTALVTERACASGRSADGRIVGPRVLALEDRVLVVFGVRSRGGAQTCQGNPSSRVKVELGEELGDRELVDPALLFDPN